MKKTKPTKKEESNQGIYKGYDIKWLSNEPDHPDFYLVAEFKEKYPTFFENN